MISNKTQNLLRRTNGTWDGQEREGLDSVVYFGIINVMWELIGIGSPSLDHNEPCNKFKNKGHGPQEDDDSGVSSSPFIFRTQDF